MCKVVSTKSSEGNEDVAKDGCHRQSQILVICKNHFNAWRRILEYLGETGNELVQLVRIFFPPRWICCNKTFSYYKIYEEQAIIQEPYVQYFWKIYS